MSTFSVPVVRIRNMEEIPGADAIELAVIGDYRSVVAKGKFKANDLAVYIPESAILPTDLINDLGLAGKLAGKDKNRVRAIKLRGCLSQGILYDKIPENAIEGDNVAELLHIIKYEPVIPAHMAGEILYLPGVPLKYDIENFKKFPSVLQHGEDVVMTEKTHGTFCGVAVIDGLNHPDLFGDNGIVYSKGMGANGFVFKNNEANANNLYVRTIIRIRLHDAIRKVFPGKSVHVLGEIYGTNVQDLTYGMIGQGFAVFDINVDGRYLDEDDFSAAALALGIVRMPVLYRGPFSSTEMYKHTDGSTKIGGGAHLREGVVVKPTAGRADPEIGRVILKSVSGNYLTRKGSTTEFA